MIKLCVLAFIIALLPHAVQASSQTYGIAMHGEPKYKADFTHLDYVNPNAPQGGDIKHAELGSFDSVNPFALRGKAAQGLPLVHDRLMRRVWDEPFTLYPLIAQRVDIPEDRSAITVHINPDAKFNNGSSITSHDILYTYQTLMEHGRPNMRRIYKLITQANIIDTYTIKFSFGEGYDQETAMIMAMMPVLSKSYWSDKDFDSATLEAPVSSGPYKISYVDVGKRITYRKDPHYWAEDMPINKGLYNFETVTYDYYRDDSIAWEAFLKGDIDVRRETDTANWATFKSGQYPNIQKTAFDHGRPVQIQSFIFNMRRPPFDDIRVRKALNLAFDDIWMNKNLYYGQKKRIQSFFENSELAAPQSSKTWSPPIATNIRKNLRKASELLTLAGWETVGGKRINEINGEPLSFEILVQKNDHEKIALNFISQLKRLGIDARVRNMDSAAFRDRLNSYDYDMVAYHWTSSLSPGTEQYQYWSCEAATQNMRWNFSGICGPEIDKIVKAIPHADNRTDIVTLVQSLDQKLLNNVTTIPLFYTPTDNYFHSDSIAFPRKTPLYGPVLETWWSTKMPANKNIEQ